MHRRYSPLQIGIVVGVVLLAITLIVVLGRQRPPTPEAPEGPLVTMAGGDRTPPSTPADLASPSQTDRTISLTWTGSTDNVGVVEYEIYNGLIRIATATGDTATLKDLRPSTTYSLTVKARDEAWNFSAPSNVIKVATAADTDRTPPSAPAEVSLVSTTDTRAWIEWAGAKDNIQVTGYDIYNGATLLASAGGSRTRLKNLAPSTTYTLTIKAKDNAGNLSPASQPITFTTGARDTQAPTAPYDLVTPEQSDRTITLRWQRPSDNYGVAAYEVYQNDAKIAETTSTNYVVGLGPGSSALYYVVARDEAGNRSPASNKVTATTGVTAYAPPGRTIRAYYAQWATYSGYQVADIDGSKITHINYAFADISDDLKIKLGDPYADVERAFPGDSPSDPYKGNLNQLRKLKQRYPHLKTVLSVGGWTWSQKFSDMTLSEARRTAFAESVVDLLVKYGFDGVDFDWEYPVAGGMPGNVRRPIDGTNLALLLQRMRQRLDERGAAEGKRYELSIAGGPSDLYVKNTPLAEIAGYLDYVQIMTYDFGGPWERSTGFNAPLYGPAGAQGPSVTKAVEEYLSKGVPASKLVLGVPFYGYEFRMTKNASNGLFQPYTGPGISRPYGEVERSFTAKEGFTRYWHPKAQVPYLWNGSSFVSYDDPESIAAKVAYLKAKGLAGAMIWEISQDPSEVLLQQLYSGLK